MYWGVVVFETLCWVGFAALVIGSATVSVRRHRVHTSAYLALAILCVSWMESPYDNSMYAVFHPDFHRLPKIGPIGLTQGRLPVIAPPGYILYFLVPAMLGVLLARSVSRRFGWRFPMALLSCGLAVGVFWDGIIETGQAQTLHLWLFDRTAPGLTLFAGERGQVPVTCFFAMGSFIMGMAYLLGRRDADDRGLVEGWVQRRTTSGSARIALTAVIYIVIAQLLYGASLLPSGLIKIEGWMTQGSVGVPYPGRIAPQALAGGAQHDGWIGTLVLVAALVILIGGIFWAVSRFDPQASRPESVEAPQRAHAVQPAS